MTDLHGIRVHVNRILCETDTFIGWKKNHRRSRINKKWHKRYGKLFRPCNGVAYLLMNDVYVCPCVMAILQNMDRL